MFDLGCPKFFEFHDKSETSLKLYAERFGYDPKTLKNTIRNTDTYQKMSKNNPSISKDTVFADILTTLDKQGLTNQLYSQQKLRLEKGIYRTQVITNMYLANILQKSIENIKKIHGDNDNNSDWNYFKKLYSLNDPYKFLSDIFSLIEQGYDLSEVTMYLEKSLERWKEKDSFIKKIQTAMLLLILKKNEKDRKVMCPKCGTEINFHDFNEKMQIICETCNFIVEEDILQKLLSVNSLEVDSLELTDDFKLNKEELLLSKSL